MFLNIAKYKDISEIFYEYLNVPRIFRISKADWEVEERRSTINKFRMTNEDKYWLFENWIMEIEEWRSKNEDPRMKIQERKSKNEASNRAWTTTWLIHIEPQQSQLLHELDLCISYH